MPFGDKRLAALSGRTDKDAWIQLYRMQHHPNFVLVLAELEKIPGTITVRHVEDAAQRFLDEK